MSKKQVIAVDIDDVLAPHIVTLMTAHNRTYGTTHNLEDYSHDNWSTLWDVSPDEAERRIRLWHSSGDLWKMPPLESSHRALKKLSEQYDLIVVTARPLRMEPLTRQWLLRHYPEVFKEIIFLGLHEEGLGKTKADFCLERHIDFLIDDSLTQAQACAAVGIRVILFGKYPWNQADRLPHGVTRCKDWHAVLEYFGAKTP